MRSNTTTPITTNKQRSFGLGFGRGNHFTLYSKEPNKGLINSIPFFKQFLSELKTDIQSSEYKNVFSCLKAAVTHKLGTDDETSINKITKDILALTIPDILVDMNISKLQKIIPNLLASCSEHAKQCITQRGLTPLEHQGGQRFLQSIITSAFGLYDENNQERIQTKKEELHTHLTNQHFHLIDKEILAYIIPALIDHLSDEDLKVVAVEIAQHLPNNYLTPLADKHYFTPEITKSGDETLAVRNANKRSLQFYTQSSNTIAHFRDHDYEWEHFHLHFENEDEESEYKIDDQQFAGEFHTIFQYNHKGNPDKKNMIAIGFPVKIGNEANPEITKLLAAINQLDDVKEWRKNGKQEELILDMKKLEATSNYRDLFIHYLDQAKKENSLLYHSWNSMRSGTYGFKSAGIRFTICPVAIIVSQSQYKELKEIFGTMNQNLSEEDKLDPIDRKAGRRKERTALYQSLKDKIDQQPQQVIIKPKGC